MSDDAGKMPCALIVMGVSGSGKSTIADKLAERLRAAGLVADLDACVRELVAAGCEWRVADDLPGVRRGHTKDPFGNRIELIEAA